MTLKRIVERIFTFAESRRLDTYLRRSEVIPGWTRHAEARALAEVAYHLPRDAVVVEIGSFLGSGAILLAGARKLRGSGRVHCVDPFNGSGDSYSVPHYETIMKSYGSRSLRELFDDNIRKAGLSDWVEAHQGSAEEIGRSWEGAIDLLFMDGDQSPAGVRRAYQAWSPWLKPNGFLALHNSHDRAYEPEHDGHHRLAVEVIQPPHYVDRKVVGSTTFARKATPI
jgi:predicted O-methyltransferase YrrM